MTHPPCVLQQVWYHNLPQCWPLLAGSLLLLCIRVGINVLRQSRKQDQLWQWRANTWELLLLWAITHIMGGREAETCLARVATDSNLAGTIMKSMAATIAFHSWFPVAMANLPHMLATGACCFLVRVIQGFRGLVATGEAEWFWAAGLSYQGHYVAALHMVPMYVACLLIYAVRFKKHSGQLSEFLERNGARIRSCL